MSSLQSDFFRQAIGKGQMGSARESARRRYSQRSYYLDSLCLGSSSNSDSHSNSSSNSIHGVTANCMFFLTGTFGVFPLIYLYVTKSDGELILFAIPLVLTPFLRSQGQPVYLLLLLLLLLSLFVLLLLLLCLPLSLFLLLSLCYIYIYIYIYIYTLIYIYIYIYILYIHIHIYIYIYCYNIRSAGQRLGPLRRRPHPGALHPPEPLSRYCNTNCILSLLSLLLLSLLLLYV